MVIYSYILGKNIEQVKSEVIGCGFEHVNA